MSRHDAACHICRIRPGLGICGEHRHPYSRRAQWRPPRAPGQPFPGSVIRRAWPRTHARHRIRRAALGLRLVPARAAASGTLHVDALFHVKRVLRDFDNRLTASPCTGRAYGQAPEVRVANAPTRARLARTMALGRFLPTFPEDYKNLSKSSVVRREVMSAGETPVMHHPYESRRLDALFHVKRSSGLSLN